MQQESPVTRKKGKPVSFDAMVKFFMMNYNIATRSDIEKVMGRIDRLEQLVRAMMLPENRKNTAGIDINSITMSKGCPVMTASDIVMETVRRFPAAAGFAEIQVATGFGEKKLRNIIFRLHKQKKLRRIKRGTYTAV
jgi:hypothetical protein